MAEYRKKPVVIEAVRAKEAIVAAAHDWNALPSWLKEAYDDGGMVFTDEGIHIPTLEGTMIAGPDDWIIRGVQGELYPCKPDIFEAIYERV